ncbi:MAG: RND family transporter, partial [Helicobacter sp.]|nr:RND family transporter [Helicobacter sp.]
MIIGAFFAIRLPIDASPDSLLLENDKDFEIYQQTIKNYGERNFLILSFNPKDEDIFSADSLQTLKRITQDLQEIPQIQSTLSILNAPLLKSSHSLSLQESLTLNLTLLSPQTDLELAKEELSNHPFYRQNLLSINKKNAGILIYLKDDSILQNLRNNIKNATNTKEKRELQKLLRKTKQQIQAQDTQTINAIKALKTKYEGLYIGGITLIASDMITYIKSDLITYGTFLSIILGFMLWLFFKQSYFVFLTLFICFYNLIISSGIFSLFGYEITVVSSNYASLMLIINVSLIIHLLVAYCEFYEKFPKASQKNLIYAVILSKKKPSFYATLTTIIGFLSLIFSNILPIIHLGIIMSLGISITLLSSFILFGVLMYLVPKPNSLKNLPKWHHRILSICANLSLNKPKTIYAITLLVFIFSLYGITQLKIENSFVNYFKDSSEIKQGLLAIDKNLGGTIALDILVTFHEEVSQALGELSDFEEEFNTLGQQDAYWFDSQKLRIAKII